MVLGLRTQAFYLFFFKASQIILIRLSPTSLKRSLNSDKVFMVTGLTRKRNWVSKKPTCDLSKGLQKAPSGFPAFTVLPTCFSPSHPSPQIVTKLLILWPVSSPAERLSLLHLIPSCSSPLFRHCLVTQSQNLSSSLLVHPHLMFWSQG